MKVKKAIEILKKYDLEEEIFFDVYTKEDIDCLADDIKVQITDKKLSEVFDVMYEWATTENFIDAVNSVLRFDKENKDES
jgi:hypothetical protein